ncbi:dynactin P62 subunit [Culex quinquefasciatus]|uniref:Dynactin subunit 4 n=1 Tax=Culex quinquefasciatus TaxID=7176 RepID=B0XIW5_CULQU|nr:dynactin P62 subunit [Culex quinquefasciatus]|eukprot:XP_001869587.1 dynactin P62 subunit [Culex quinquefasciatus]
MGVRKRPMEKEQLLEPVPVFCHDKDKHERSDLRGILMGLVAAILMMLQNRGASYKQQYGPYQIALYSMFVVVMAFFTRTSGRRQNVHDTPQHAKQSGRKLAHHRSAVDGRRADVAATAGEEEKKEEPPTTGNQWRQGSGRSRSTRMRLDLDCCCRLRRKTPKTSKFLSLTDRTGEMVSMIRRQMGWTDSEEQIKATPSPINRSVAIEAVDEFPDCDHNVTKSKYNPSSIKYRIAMFAVYHVPKVRFIRCEPLMFNQKAILLLKLINPTINDMTITIMELPTDEEERRMIEELKLSAEATVSSSSSSLMLVGRGAALLEDPRMMQQSVNGTFSLHFFSQNRNRTVSGILSNEASIAIAAITTE